MAKSDVEFELRSGHPLSMLSTLYGEITYGPFTYFASCHSSLGMISTPMMRIGVSTDTQQDIHITHIHCSPFSTLSNGDISGISLSIWLELNHAWMSLNLTMLSLDARSSFWGVIKTVGLYLLLDSERRHKTRLVISKYSDATPRTQLSPLDKAHHQASTRTAL